MKSLLILSLFLFSTIANAAFVLNIENNSFTGSLFYIGKLDIRGCNSVSLNLTPLSQGPNTASCVQQRVGADLKVTLLIPVKISLQSDSPMLLSMSTVSINSNFTEVAMYKTRNGSKGGGINMMTSSTLINDDDVIDAELELTASVIGSNAKSSYETYLVFTISEDI